ncbi:jg23036 [Pararge aegeria aegeria]|uniref:Jg23036 protein n=1 Tax=Pararge aegeria aegeria TaxID=348720 RepID=A0A8S4SPP6_9NEOP|nr:jg23036 [Pararge aegeria aegeria]
MMHSNEAPPPATGTGLLLQLGRLIVRARSSSPSPRRVDARPSSSSQQVNTQPKSTTDEIKPGVEAQLNNHVQALWKEQIPICIEVLLAPECQECYASISRMEEEGRFDKLPSQHRALLLERWTVRPIANKNHDNLAAITPHWLLNAVRSQLHFSQLSAWRATIKTNDDKPAERRRKLSRETCNFKKIEANCDDSDLDERKLNIVYSIKIPGESYKMADFTRPPTDHQFPVTDIGDNVYLKVLLQTLPRLDDIPIVKCTCKRRASKEVPPNVHEELVGKLSDLTLGPRNAKYPTDAINSNIGPSNRRLSIISNTGTSEYVYTMDKDKKILDDRMLTPCSESGKHKCNCDEESDDRSASRSPTSPTEAKKLDDRRTKEIAKYKRRLRKESKLKKLCDSTSSEGDGLKAKETHTSIPILQAARFDRFRAIGCFRNQTYLTLPASRIESRSPFTETLSIQPTEFRRTNTVATQTEDIVCNCGNNMELKCITCLERGMVRSEGNYNLASIENGESKTRMAMDNGQHGTRSAMANGDASVENGHRMDNGDDRAKLSMENWENGARRKCEDDGKQLKKLKCDNSVKQCDNISLDTSDKCEIIKRPKLKRFPITDRIEKVISDRFAQNNDIEQLNLLEDDTVFLTPKTEVKRQKTYSVGEDYVLFEKCDYGTFDKCEVESPKDDADQKGFGQKFPEHKKTGQDNQVPSPTEMDRFRWRFDSAASMVFHSKSGLPLTSSPAPLRRGNNCFDFDDSINGVSGIKSALFHPISPPSPVPASPVSPARQTPPPRKTTPHNKLRMGPSTGLLGKINYVLPRW